MHVAELTLCKELYELSGWGDPDGGAPAGEYGLYFTEAMWCQESEKSDWDLYTEASDHTMYGNNHLVPAYDLSFLLVKLPHGATVSKSAEREHYGAWLAGVTDLEHAMENPTFQEADTPEDSACKLAIELFKSGVLQKGEA